MTVVSLDMAYCSFREVLAGLDTRLDTPPSIDSHHPDSGLAPSRRTLIFLGATLLAIITFFILLVPSSAPILIAIGAGFGSLLMTVAGMRFRRRQVVMRQELDILTESVRKLESAGERQLLQSINAKSHQGSVDVSEQK